ncbi:MAG: NAD(P)H-hydrate dehydratase [Pseudomonadales bacterium]|jgi:NAD(P)H-hydrate epimerase|nr:NAD(P)H-hydrate dehydratase [Pseudomonadales bacterium]
MTEPTLPDPLPGVQRLHTAAVTRQLDRRAIEGGIPGIHLMRRAGAAAFSVLRERWPGAGSLTVLCGRGNNAGDGYVVGGLACARGWQVQLLQLGDAGVLSGDAARARDWALGEGVRITTFEPGVKLEGEVIVDALLGTGIEGDVRPEFAAAIEAINTAGVPVLAVDLPSGLCADTGAVLGTAVRASHTVTFIAAKRGLFTGRGPAFAGRVSFAALGVPAAVLQAGDLPVGVGLLRLAEGELVLPPRPADAHKGAFGHVLVVGGDHGYGGAVLLAAEAALRAGAGLVSVATRARHVPALLARRPEVMAHAVDARSELVPLLERATAVVIGPGLGRSPWAEQLLDAVLECGRPLVVDADALTLLARDGTAPRADWVLTPHPGEAARLLGTDTAAIAADRFAAARALVHRYGGVSILKGAGSLIAAGDAMDLCPYGNPGMASGGMGDVLAGIIGALVAQGLAPDRAARLAACLHGAAADLARDEIGMPGLLASDLFRPLARLLARVCA